METADEAGAGKTRRRLVAIAVFLLALLSGFLAWSGRDAEPVRVEPAVPKPGPTSPTGREAPAAAKPRHAANAEPGAPSKADESARRDEAPKTRPLRVTVVAAHDGRAVEGALVIVGGGIGGDVPSTVRGTTGADGIIALQIDPANGERVTVRKVGFVVGRANVPPDSPDEFRVELTAGVPLAGRVVFADSRAPAAGVAVRAWRTDTTGSNDGAEVDVPRVTDEAGRFELCGVPPGKTVSVFAVKPGYRTADAIIARDQPGPEIELVLGDGGVLEGFVYDVDGKPAPEVDVYLLRTDIDVPDPSWTGGDTRYVPWAQQGFIFPATRTDAAGRYEYKGVRLPINGVPQPRLAAARDAKGRTAKSEPATFTRHAERMQRDIRFASSPAITVRVSWTCPPPQAFKVRVQPNGPNRTSEFGRELAPDVGATTFEGLLAGLYFVSVEVGDRMFDGCESMREVTVKDGERAEVAFTANGKERIEGVVVDGAGKPVPDVALKFEAGDRSTDGSFESRTTTRADGTFAFERLAPTSGTVELDGMMTVMRRRMSSMAERRDVPEETSFATLRVADVHPGGPALRLVLHRRGQITGRFVPTPAQKDHITLGQVTDDDWGSGWLTIADDGRFTGTLSIVGRPVDLYFKADGCAPVVFDDRTIAPGGTLDLGEIKFDAGLSFDGVLRHVDGRPVANAEVYGNDPWIDRLVASDADGKFRLDHLPRRAVHLSVRATQGAASWRLTIDPALGTGTFTIGEGVVVAGRVVDAAGGPARKAGIRLLPNGAGKMESAGAAYFDTDADGRFEVRVAPGTFRVEVRRREYAAAVSPATVEIKDGENAPLELRLR